MQFLQCDCYSLCCAISILGVEAVDEGLKPFQCDCSCENCNFVPYLTGISTKWGAHFLASVNEQDLQIIHDACDCVNCNFVNYTSDALVEWGDHAGAEAVEDLQSFDLFSVKFSYVTYLTGLLVSVLLIAVLCCHCVTYGRVQY